MNILIISDAWHPQVNGVVRTLENTARELKELGHNVHVHGPNARLWTTVAAPSYASIKLEFFGRGRLRQTLREFKPDLIHIATEGPLGWTGRNLCLALSIPFTTSYHTQFPEYIAARLPSGIGHIARFISYAVLRRFHAPASAVMVATSSIQHDLQRRKFRHIVRWSRGVDMNLFQPYGKNLLAYENLPRPVMLNVGRVAVEKNLTAFLDCDVEGSKVIIGDGPDVAKLRKLYPEAHFLGPMEGEKLARHYAAADLFVFPSRTDTFGLVLLEACSSGLRVASYPSAGPVDIFAAEETRSFAALDSNLHTAITRALALPDQPENPRNFVSTHFSWTACSRIFFDHLQSPTPKAVRRIIRLKHWLACWWQRGLALLLR